MPQTITSGASLAERLLVREPSTRRGTVLTIANLKGGVSKTTTAVNLACGLSRGIENRRSGGYEVPPLRVLLIDTEPLCTASTWLGVSAEGVLDSCAALLEEPPMIESLLDRDISEAIESGYAASLLALPRQAAHEPLHVIPAESGAIDLADSQNGESEFCLRGNLEILRRYYDVIIIDTPANARNRMLRSSLVAADGVIIPIPPSSAALTSVSPLFRIIRDIKRGANREIDVHGLLISNAGSRRDRDAIATRNGLREHTALPVFESVIRTLKAIQRSAGARRSVFSMAEADEAIQDYEALVREWYARHGKEATGHGE